jgi:SAM-dependent methyltransferase
MSFFNTKTAAERYHAGRPDFHALVIDHARSVLNIAGKLPAALDVACGTGLSTKALLPLAERVYGIDVSANMLNIAHAADQIHYQLAPAENLPFEDEKFDLLTVSSAVHWFDIGAFLAEAGRVLKTNGKLLIYVNYFTGRMADNPDFLNWVNGVYLRRFPSPPRNNNYDWSGGNPAIKKFNIFVPEEFENEVSFNRQQLISYLTTQSNIEAAVEKGIDNYEEIENWLEDELSPFFDTDARMHSFMFGNRLKYLEKIAADE